MKEWILKEKFNRKMDCEKEVCKKITVLSSKYLINYSLNHERC